MKYLMARALLLALLCLAGCVTTGAVDQPEITTAIMAGKEILRPANGADGVLLRPNGTVYVGPSGTVYFSRGGEVSGLDVGAHVATQVAVQIGTQTAQEIAAAICAQPGVKCTLTIGGSK